MAASIAVFCCVALTSGDASATVEWGRVGEVTTLTSGQLCKNDGKYIICDSTTPTISSGNVGIGSTSPAVSLDISQMTDALALPSGTSGQRPTGANLLTGEIRYDSSTPGIEAYYNGAWNTLLSSGTSGGSVPAAGSNGQIQFNNSGHLGASSSFVWDNTNGRVGIGTASPASALDVSGQIRATGFQMASGVAALGTTVDGLIRLFVVGSGSTSATLDFAMLFIKHCDTSLLCFSTLTAICQHKKPPSQLKSHLSLQVRVCTQLRQYQLP
jgi:hypothetical protein